MKKAGYYAKTKIGIIIENCIGVPFLLLGLPFILIYFLGYMANKICNQIAKIEDYIIRKVLKVIENDQ